jgi:hypothetical protein
MDVPEKIKDIMRARAVLRSPALWVGHFNTMIPMNMKTRGIKPSRTPIKDVHVVSEYIFKL